MSPGATMASRRLHEPQAISINPVDLGLPHPAGSMDPGDLRYRPRVVADVEIWRGFSVGDGMISSPGATGPRRWREGQLSPRAGSMSASQSAITQLGRGFHTLRGGIHPEDLPLRPRVVGAVEIWKDFSPGDRNSSSPGAAGPRRYSEGHLPRRAGSISPSLSAITQWGWGFHTPQGGIDPGDLRSRPRVIGCVEIWKDFSPGDGNLSSLGAVGPRRYPEGQPSPPAGSMSPSQ